MDDAGGGRRGLRPTLSETLLPSLLASYDLDLISPPIDLGGSSNLNLVLETRSGRFVARLYRSSVTANRLEAIQAARRALVAAAIPAATLQPTRAAGRWIDIDGHLAEVETFVTSDSQMNQWPLLLKGLPTLGRIHSVFARLVVPDDGIDPLFANYLPPDTAVSAVRRATERIRARQPTDEELVIAHMADELVATVDHDAMAAFPRQLVHGDYWDNNVLFRNGQLVLVSDLDFMGYRARVDDLALTLYFAALEPASGVTADRAGAMRLRQLVDAYEDGLDDPLTVDERAALPWALARQPLWSLGVWGAELDDDIAVRHQTMALTPELEWGLAVARNVDMWREALS